MGARITVTPGHSAVVWINLTEEVLLILLLISVLARRTTSDIGITKTVPPVKACVIPTGPLEFRTKDPE